MAHKKGRNLSAADWARAALYAWGRAGLKAVAVESLARELGVTKGSFYWHFKNRDALIRAAMELWEQEGTEEVIAALEREPSPNRRLLLLFESAWERIDHMRVEAAMAATALTGHEAVTAIYDRVHRRRLGYVAGLYREMGFDKMLAYRRAITTYSAFLGSLQIVALGDRSLETQAQLRKQVAVFRQLLIPD